MLLVLITKGTIVSIVNFFSSQLETETGLLDSKGFFFFFLIPENKIKFQNHAKKFLGLDQGISEEEKKRCCL